MFARTLLLFFFRWKISEKFFNVAQVSREVYTCKQKDAHARISFSRNFISGISLEREEIYLN